MIIRLDTRFAISKLLIGLLLLSLPCGCRKPSFYRRQADRDANCMVDQKSAAAGVAPGEYRIDIDPRSRMYDPNNPDCEPMPPDDPTSNQLMQCVDCKKGEKCWKCLPRTPFVENPGWYEHLPFDERGEVVLDLQAAVQLARRESPRYQSQLEELYLSALDVTFERFRFDCQFFGGSSIFFTADGEVRSGTGAPSSELDVSPSNPNSTLRVSKLTATGGELAVGLANSLVWQFAGPDDYSGTSLLDFSLVQPLLRASGRGRVLERLTISERTLLANVRQMERFRRNFYFSVFSGDDPGQGPSRRGGFFGGSGLDGFSGVGGGGFGRVGGGGNGGNFGFNGNTGGAGAQGAGGYLGLLQTAQVLRNQRANVAALRDSVLQLEASNDAGRIDRFQVDLARQALFNAQSQLLSSENQFQTSLENFKVTIGLPPELPLRVSDPMLDRLNLLDPDLDALQKRVADTLAELRQLREERQPQADLPADQELVVPNLPVAEEEVLATPLSEQLVGYLAAAAEMKATATERLQAVKADFETLESGLPERRRTLERLANRPELIEANIDPILFDPLALTQRVDKRRTELMAIERQLQRTLDSLDQLANNAALTAEQTLDELIDSMSAMSGQLLELTLAQASARLEAINFSPVDLTSEQALAIASNYRRDWMNARANLVDAWRLIYFNANDLQSDLDLVFSGDLGNVGDNPFRFRDTNGRLRVGLEFDAPLTRLAERNVYRQSLIEYQQARRSYYQFRDRLYQGLRNTLRQIRLNEINFELRRAAVQVAISQVDLTQLRLSEPPKPGETTQFGSTTARDLVQALSDLLNVQNDFLSVWVNHEVQKLNLEIDLGVMELTPTGQRLENNMPLETYLAGLPINSSDLGPFVTHELQSQPIELIHPDSVVPESSAPDSRRPNDTTLPPPADGAILPPGDTSAIQLISAELPWANVSPAPEIPTPLPPID
ncbi:MAG: TolC family protein [Planctomycetota bacterium]